MPGIYIQDVTLSRSFMSNIFEEFTHPHFHGNIYIKFDPAKYSKPSCGLVGKKPVTKNGRFPKFLGLIRKIFESIWVMKFMRHFLFPYSCSSHFQLFVHSPNKHPPAPPQNSLLGTNRHLVLLVGSTLAQPIQNGLAIHQCDGTILVQLMVNWWFGFLSRDTTK